MAEEQRSQVRDRDIGVGDARIVYGLCDEYYRKPCTPRC